MNTQANKSATLCTLIVLGVCGAPVEACSKSENEIRSTDELKTMASTASPKGLDSDALWWHLKLSDDGRVSSLSSYGFPALGTESKSRKIPEAALQTAIHRDTCELNSTLRAKPIQCALQVVESRVLLNSSGAPLIAGAPNLVERKLILSACGADEVNGQPFLPGTATLLKEMCAPIDEDPPTNRSAIDSVNVLLEERIAFGRPAEELFVLEVEIALDEQTLHGGAQWVGVFPPARAWNVGRLIALGCAYSSVSDAARMSSHPLFLARTAVILEQLDSEFALRRPFAYTELGIYHSWAAFQSMETASQMSNWWHCVPLDK